MAYIYYQERRRCFAVQVCSTCRENDPGDEELMRVYCRAYSRHKGAPAALVTWSEKKWTLVEIRPFPNTALTHGRYIKCAGGKVCRGDQCTYAHSHRRMRLWNIGGAQCDLSQNFIVYVYVRHKEYFTIYRLIGCDIYIVPHEVRTKITMYVMWTELHHHDFFYNKLMWLNNLWYKNKAQCNVRPAECDLTTCTYSLYR